MVSIYNICNASLANIGVCHFSCGNCESLVCRMYLLHAHWIIGIQVWSGLPGQEAGRQITLISEPSLTSCRNRKRACRRFIRRLQPKVISFRLQLPVYILNAVV